ncbi:ferredoxin reductase family protein [Methylocaldum sp. 14B]|jgi:predicted ferric reductase|uniref:ferredoxin reductase family protein n=1 Tax=Methylocaldum sp. 14B TaxID=1912213 RepID=UPI00197C0FC3|nr:ferredoxin reductase family protein [Methylocaldum sp. 14B]
MYIKTWHAVLFLTVTSGAVVIAEIPRDTWLTSAALSLALGVAAVAMMGAAAILGSRWTIVESLFGGLDRVYLTHKWLGIWALGFASFHFVFRAGLPTWDSAPILSLSPYYTRLVRQLSFIGLMLIVLLALNRNIPYGVWRRWHKLSGPLFLIVILHWLSFRSPLAIESPAGIWLASLSALGVVAAGYKLLIYPFLANHAEYRVVAANPGADALHLELAPVDRGISFEPGQFGFIRMKAEGLREPHPFTIAARSKPEGHVHFVIRALGDYTRKLVNEASVGMYADIYAPYGRFRRSTESQREVWIGGGVGISPFIAWLTDPSAGNFDRVTLFHFFTPGREFPSVEVLDDLARQRGAEFIPVSTGPSTPEFIRRFDEIARSAGPAGVDVNFCGPRGLLDHVRARMRENGIPDTNLRYEYFEFR